MKVAAKLTSIIVATMCAVIAAGTVVRWRHDRAVFEDDMARDHMALGRYAAGSIAQALLARGPNGAVARVERMNERNPDIHIRWLPEAPPLAAGRRDGRFYSYTALPPESPDAGTIEISESLERERANMRADLKQAMGLALAMAGMAALLSSLLGYRLLGRPLALLARKARQVGAGQLGPPVVVANGDELGELAREMNLMCDRLAEANARAVAEGEARAAAQEALRQSDRLATVGKLAAGLAHELGTPLNVVAARAAMIAALEAQPDQLASYGRIIQAQAERMNRILRQLMDFARGGAAPVGARAARTGTDIDLADL
ncbi:MAG TPA: histidine kinase dimerization/phospho-acceptor domain-containing protein, partial [Polyangia bacterium]